MQTYARIAHKIDEPSSGATMTAEPQSQTLAPFEVPIIDIGAYVYGKTPEARRPVALAIDEAARNVGFLQLRGHGIAEPVLAGLAAAIDAFFALPADRKGALRAPPRVNRGYTPPHAESLSRSLGIAEADGTLDYFEAFNIGAAASDFPALDLSPEIYAENLWPESAPGFDAAAFRAAVEAYFGEAQRVARTLCLAFADALGVAPQCFESVTDHSIDVLRMNHYALPAGVDSGTATPTGMGAHTDYGIVTVLWADPVPGLEVLGWDGFWHPVQPAPGCLLVNLGDLTARWTNDRWRSTLHRVCPPVVEGRIVRRRSAALFHDGNVDALIETLPACLGPQGSSYAPITVGDHLAAKLAGSREGDLNTAAGWEADRVRAAHGSAADVKVTNP